ncbi:MAG TPA: hypothetical protein VLN74_03715 [Ilumatobacteraceae bacterium]|nr:hypothetical protein [Ilumatobacteraceae bacterium]
MRGVQLLAPLPGDAGLMGDTGLTGLMGDTGLGTLTGLSGLTGLMGDTGLATLATLTGLTGDTGESISRGAGAGSTAIVGVGDGTDTSSMSTRAGIVTEAADASWATVVGTTTGADSRGALLALSSRITPSGVGSQSASGAANANPPTATPAMVPAVAAIFQFNLFGLVVMSIS